MRRSRRKQLPAPPAKMESMMAIEMPDARNGAIAAAWFVATEVDGSGDAECGHLQGSPVASGESGSGSIGGKQGLALALQPGEE